jgi:hypothetical protein
MHEALDTLPRMAHLIDEMFISPIFTATEIARWGHTSRPTARRDIEALEKAGFVRYLAGERPKSYYVPEIFALAYNEGNTVIAASSEAPSEAASEATEGDRGPRQ